MKTKNKLLTLLALSSSAIAITALINKCIQLAATSKNLLKGTQSLNYQWKFGNIHYTKTGSGKPLLLVHDLNSASSSYEWSQIINTLKEDYTVYAIDLLGCGRSEKPCLTYTNYLYVQLISDFIKSEIGHRTDIIATGGSAALAIMACNNSPELFNRLLLVNPDSILSCSQLPGKYAKMYKMLLDFPIIGTLLYHIAAGKQQLQETFMTEYFYDYHSVKPSYINAYYEASHLGHSPKSIYASVHCNYTKCNIINALKKVDNSIYLLGGAGMEGMKALLQEYTTYNSAIEYTLIPETKYLPQLEKPEEFISNIKTFLTS